MRIGGDQNITWQDMQLKKKFILGAVMHCLFHSVLNSMQQNCLILFVTVSIAISFLQEIS